MHPSMVGQFFCKIFELVQTQVPPELIDAKAPSKIVSNVENLCRLPPGERKFEVPLSSIMKTAPELLPNDHDIIHSLKHHFLLFWNDLFPQIAIQDCAVCVNKVDGDSGRMSTHINKFGEQVLGHTIEELAHLSSERDTLDAEWFASFCKNDDFTLKTGFLR